MNQEVVRAGEIAAMMNRARSNGFDVIRWPTERGGGFLMWSEPVWVLVNCSDERWCNAWGKMATVGSLDEMEGLMESIRARMETA